VGEATGDAFRALGALRGETQAEARYEPFAVLGQGGFARVFRARDRKLQRDVALKQLRTDRALPVDAWVRFRREAEVLARLSHPNIVAVHDTLDRPPTIVLELVEGEPLSKKLQGRLDLRAGLVLLEKVARAVHHAHGLCVIHRDLKPQNILVTASLEPKVADFGLARLMDDELRLTRTGTFLGSPSYMAPEQALGELDRIDARTDVYALGAILHEIVLGVPPFSGESPETLILYKTQRDVEAPDDLDPAVPRAALAIAIRALARDPERRYVSAEAMADDIRRFLDGRAPRAVGGSRSPWLVLFGFLAALTIGFALLTTAPEAGDPRRPERGAPPPSFVKPVVAAHPRIVFRPGHTPSDAERAEASRHAMIAFVALVNHSAALAADEARRSLELDPETWEPWTALARAQLLSGDRAGAFDTLDDGVAFFEERGRDIEKRPGDPFVAFPARLANDHFLYQLVFHRAKLNWSRERSLVVGDFVRAKSLDSTRSEAGAEHARYLIEHEHDPQAALEALGYPSPDDWLGLLVRAEVRIQLQELDAAIGDATNALAHVPDGPEHAEAMARVLSVRGLARLARGDKAGARADLETALRVDPTEERQRAVDDARR